tara:strand:- start:20 stop:1363 length:1344 start_codon:yes stop_codon:yes gene_type:complete
MSKINTRPVTVEGKRYSLSIVDGKIMGASELDQPNSLAKPVDSRTLNKIVADSAILDVYNGAVNKGNTDNNIDSVGDVQLGSAEERGQFFADQDKKFRNAQFVAEENIKQEKANIAAQNQRNIRQELNMGAKSGKFSSQILAYPFGFDTNQDHLKITRHEYRRPDINASKSGNVTMQRLGTRGEDNQYNSAGDTVAGALLGSILLPMPKVADVNGVEWGKSELTSSGLAALGTARALDLGGFFTGKTNEERRKDREANDLLTEGNSTNVEGNAVTEFARGGFATLQSKLANVAFGTNLDPDTALARTSGRVFNPNAEVLFQGPVIRDFSFSFIMIARSQQEGAEIRKIIRFLKLGMAPKFRSTTFLKNPDVFILEYRSGNRTLDTVNRFNPGGLALQTMSVDYSPNGYWSSYRDSQPVQLKMDLSFTELRPIYQGDQEMTPENSVGY